MLVTHPNIYYIGWNAVDTSEAWTFTQQIYVSVHAVICKLDTRGDNDAKIFEQINKESSRWGTDVHWEKLHQAGKCQLGL